MENHDYNEIVGAPEAPYINSLIDQYGLATNYMDSGTHPSLPTYLYLISGKTDGGNGWYPAIFDTDPTQFGFPYADSNPTNLGGQLEAAGIPWRSYQESMGSACKLSASGNYAPKHDPFLYFDNIQNGANNLCKKTNVDYSNFAADLAAGTYKYMWITPNLVSDGHDPADDPKTAMKQSDAWLKKELKKILNSDAYKNGGVVFLTWDEAEGRNGDSGDQVPMIVISPKLKQAGYKTNTALSHASYLATIEELFGLDKLGDAADPSVATLMEFFQ
jgi:phospholipase C